MPKLILNIPDLAKAKEFLTHFVPNLTFIETAEILEDSKENKAQHPMSLHEVKDIYAIEDIEAIVDKFPKDYQWTYQDLVTYFPSDLPLKIEIIHNQIYLMPTPSTTHQIISDELVFQFNLFVRAKRLGRVLSAPMDTKLDEDNVVQPDILFVGVSRYHLIEKNCIAGSPDIVVEIWSPGNTKAERKRKHDLYQSKAVTEYWQIEPTQKEVLVKTLNKYGKYEVFSEAKASGTVKSSVLEGFELDLKQLFGAL